MDSDLHCITNEFPNHPFYQLYLDRPNTFDIFNVKHQNANIEPAMSFQRRESLVHSSVFEQKSQVRIHYSILGLMSFQGYGCVSLRL